MNAFIVSFLFFLGAVVGSFLNVCIDRMPAGLSVWHPPSKCGACGHAIRWYDNLPVLSWILLRGRCRDCGASFSVRHVLIEALCGLLLIAVWFVEGGINTIGSGLWPFASFVAKAFFTLVLVAVTLIDLEHTIIPDRITYPAMAVALSARFMEPGLTHALVDAAGGALVGAGSLWLIGLLYQKATGREGMGLGDVKLMVSLGIFLGIKGAFLVLLLSSLAGSIISGVLIALHRLTGKTAIPYGPFLAAGAWFIMFFGQYVSGKLF